MSTKLWNQNFRKIVQELFGHGCPANNIPATSHGEWNHDTQKGVDALRKEILAIRLVSFAPESFYLSVNLHIGIQPHTGI